ncbi:MAG: hypothetical protein HY290_11635 [Planctomycetia bacterium]|nr:hypothetical protein [Planctomycetia bacterium]
MAKLIRLSQVQRDNLVAYLDGELDETVTQEIEQVLAVSEVARHEVDMLSRSWDMLNALPTYRASNEFTERTVTSMRAAEQKGSRIPTELLQRQARRGVVLAVWAAILILCGYVGFAATNRWVPNDSEALLEDYDVINNLDKYSDSLTPADPANPQRPTEFLELLKSKRTFSEHDDHGSK